MDIYAGWYKKKKMFYRSPYLVSILATLPNVFARPHQPGSPSQTSWNPPQKTEPDGINIQIQRQVRSPRPTAGPKLGHMLEPRLAGYTLDQGNCGFGSADQVPRICPSDLVCGSYGDYLGCCHPNAGCKNKVHTTCIDFNGYVDNRCKDIGSETTCCSKSAFPGCNTLVQQTLSSNQKQFFTLVHCETTSGIGALLDYDPRWSKTHIFSSTETESEPLTTESITSSAAKITSTTASPPTPAPTAAGDNKHTNVGAIAGGTVGGVVGLALIGAAIFFCLRKRRSGNAVNGPPEGYSADAKHFSGAHMSQSSASYLSGVPSSNMNSFNYGAQPYQPNMSPSFQQPTQQQQYHQMMPADQQYAQYDYLQPHMQQGYQAAGTGVFHSAPPGTSSSPQELPSSEEVAEEITGSGRIQPGGIHNRAELGSSR